MLFFPIVPSRGTLATDYMGIVSVLGCFNQKIMMFCNVKKGFVLTVFCFWTCFADLPMGGLKKGIGYQCIRKAVHNTFQAVSWKDVRIRDIDRCQISRQPLKVLPWSFLQSAV